MWWMIIGSAAGAAMGICVALPPYRKRPREPAARAKQSPAYAAALATAPDDWGSVEVQRSLPSEVPDADAALSQPHELPPRRPPATLLIVGFSAGAVAGGFLGKFGEWLFDVIAGWLRG